MLDELEPKNNFFSKIYHRFITIRGTPQSISLGFALGIFIGLSPTMGFQIAIAVFLAALLKWNKISAATAVWITNPFTAPFIYSITYLTGAKLMGIDKPFGITSDLSFSAIIQMIKTAPKIIGALTLGGAVIGLPLAIISYFVLFNIVKQYQDKIKRIIAQKKEEHRISHQKKINKKKVSKRRRSRTKTIDNRKN